MRVLVVTGASGGHICPAVAFLEKLQESMAFAEGLLALPARSTGVDLGSIKYGVVYLSSPRLSLSLSYKNIKGSILFLKGAWQGLLILLRFKPDLVVGFGSLDSVPLVMMAWFLRIKTLIHEQNVLPGRANRFLAKFSDRVAVSFSDSKRYFDLREDKVFFTGNPIRGSLKRRDKKESLRILGLDEGKLTILVMGGSQGSARINEAFLKAAELIYDKNKFQVLHIMGRGGLLKPAQDRYQNAGIKAKVFLFCQDMGLVYNCADLAVTRAGATSISELIYFRIPAVLLPYPFAYRHQFYNAQAIENIAAGVIIKDEEVNPGLIQGTIQRFISSPGLLAGMRDNYRSIINDNAAERLLEVSESLVYRN